MAKVTLPTTFIDGSALPVADLNRSLYSTTPGEGLYSEPNGGIDLRNNVATNGSSDFSLSQEHLQPEQVVKTRFDGSWHTLDNTSDVNGGTTVNENDVEVARVQSLPGCGLRVYVPFDKATLRWNVSFFWYVAKFFGLSATGQPLNFTCEGGAIQTFLFVDDIEQSSWRRQYPMTWFKDAVADYTSGGTANNAPYSTEAEQACFTNLSYLQTNVSRGFHEIYLGFYVKPTRSTSGGIAIFQRGTIPKYDKDNATRVKNLELYQRLGIGCRNARVVAFR
jgi:hypothetical protein